LYRLCLDVAFVFQAGSDDGNLWLFNLKNGECFFKRGREAIEGDRQWQNAVKRYGMK